MSDWLTDWLSAGQRGASVLKKKRWIENTIKRSRLNIWGQTEIGYVWTYEKGAVINIIIIGSQKCQNIFEIFLEYQGRENVFMWTKKYTKKEKNRRTKEWGTDRERLKKQWNERK